jgi:uncharacterized protein (TIGR02594 family)
MRLTQKRAIILLCSVAVAAFATPALARPAHHHRHSAAPTMTQAQNTGADRDMRYPSNAAPAATSQVAADTTGRRGRRHGSHSLEDARAQAQSHSNSAYGGFTSDALVSEARKYIGTNPTGRGSLWCGAFMDLVLKRTGHSGGGNLASAYARYGTHVSGPQVGAIAVMRGHVGVVSGIDANGNPIVVSGNHNHTVAESVYPRSRISAYVMPGG